MNRVMSVVAVMMAVCSLSVVAGCDDGGDGDIFADAGGDTAADVGDETIEDDPERYFSGADSALLGGSSSGAQNEARCSTCHSSDGAQEGYSGRPINDTFYLTSYKNYPLEALREDALVGAINFCLQDYMGTKSTGLLTEDSPEYESLAAFIESVSDPSVTTPIDENPEVLDDLAAYESTYAATDGDPSAGAEAWGTWCFGCHNDTQPLTMIEKGGGGFFAAYGLDELATTNTDGQIARKVRTSGDFIPAGSNVTPDIAKKTPGPMPYFLTEILPQDDLRNIIAYIRTQGAKCEDPEQECLDATTGLYFCAETCP